MFAVRLIWNASGRIGRSGKRRFRVLFIWPPWRTIITMGQGTSARPLTGSFDLGPATEGVQLPPRREYPI